MKAILSAALLLLVNVAKAGDMTWDERLARACSGRLAEIDAELADLDPELTSLPRIPLDDQGGTGGFASISFSATAPSTVEIQWPAEAAVDQIALVPARRYDAAGLDAQYGLPEAFGVELLDSAGKVVATVAAESSPRVHPVRRGHPFIYQVTPPVAACGLRISATRLHPDAEGEGAYVHAWAEAFVFAGERNVALGAKVRTAGGGAPTSPWHWHADFLVDGQTPLGLPEVPAGEHGNIGWISEGRPKATDAAAMTVDLGAAVLLDAVRLIPAKRPTSDLPSGFGFPRKLVLATATEAPADPNNWTVLGERELRNPGHNPVLLPVAPTRARYLKIQATELWKAFDSYPAFLALSELEVLGDGKNLALNQMISSPDGMPNIVGSGGRYWSSAALSDGFGPDGRLVSTRAWLATLDRRLQIETRCHDLRAEATRTIAAWHRIGRTTWVTLGLLGVFLIVVLPIRYRRHARRELLKVRERIAGDLHDEVGSNLGSIQMLADLSQGRSGHSDELQRIQRIAGETVSAVRDIVWLLRPEGEHRIGTVEHLRETSSIMLESLDWKFTANEQAWHVELPDDATRHLFLFFREALHNIIRHAAGTKVEIHVAMTDGKFRLSIADNGSGIAPDRLERPATLHALRQRAEALGAEFTVASSAETGTRLTLAVPVPRQILRQLQGSAGGMS